MTAEERDWLRSEIDQARRARLRRARTEHAPDRAAYFASWHAKNRERRLKAARDRRARLKDAA